MKTYKNAKILVVLSIILLMAFAGCTAKNEQTIQTPGGDVKVVEGAGPDWCKAGTKTTQSGPTGEQVSFEVKGIVNYEGKEVCESGWTSGDGSVATYTNEDSTYYVMIVKDKSGKVMNKVDMSQPKQ